jgi:hypothetical protein
VHSVCAGSVMQLLEQHTLCSCSRPSCKGRFVALPDSTAGTKFTGCMSDFEPGKTGSALQERTTYLATPALRASSSSSVHFCLGRPLYLQQWVGSSLQITVMLWTVQYGLVSAVHQFKKASPLGQQQQAQATANRQVVPGQS